MRSESRCDCAVCYGYRLATRVFLFGLALLLILAAMARGAEPQPLLVDGTSAPSHQASAPRAFPEHLAEARTAVPLMPPAQFRQDADAIVMFRDAKGIGELCGRASKPGQMILSCSGEKDGLAVLALPNPCLLAEADFYAAVVCHELAHRNGWRHG